MRIFRKTDRTPWGKPYYRWMLFVPDALVQQLGWQHRDDIHLEIGDGELRASRRGPRDTSRDRVRGGRYDPVSGELRGRQATEPVDLAHRPGPPSGGPRQGARAEEEGEPSL